MFTSLLCFTVLPFSPLLLPSPKKSPHCRACPWVLCPCLNSFTSPNPPLHNCRSALQTVFFFSLMGCESLRMPPFQVKHTREKSTTSNASCGGKTNFRRSSPCFCKNSGIRLSFLIALSNSKLLTGFYTQPWSYWITNHFCKPPDYKFSLPTENSSLVNLTFLPLLQNNRWKAKHMILALNNIPRDSYINNGKWKWNH